MICLLLGIALPTDPANFENDQYWRICWGFPIFSIGTGTCLLITYFREDSLVFLIKNDKKEEALDFIRRIYDKSEDFESVYDSIKANIKIEQKKVSFKDALCGGNYRRATWICFVLAIFN